MQDTTNPAPDDAGRRALMALLVRVPHETIAAGLARLRDLPAFDDLRAPEIGLVMLRGRIAGTGAPFNLGEATATRAAVRLSTGAVGFGYSLGRDRGKARLIALADALWSDVSRREELETAVLAPIRQALAAQDGAAAARTAATRVDFFTMVRGEDGGA